MSEKTKRSEWDERYKKRHPDQVLASKKKWAEENPTPPNYHREWHLKKRYGLTLEAFESMLNGQGRRCIICGSDQWGKLGPCVDHDHETGDIRGILCCRCNLVAGIIEKNSYLVKRFVKYLGVEWEDEATVDTSEKERGK